MENCSVVDILKTIERETRYVFFFSDEIKQELLKPASIHAKDQPLETVLDRIFTSTALSYTIKNRQVGISLKEKPRKPTPEPPEHPSSGKIIISGKIKNRSDEPLPGVSILCRTFNTGTISDENGAFSLEIPTAASLEISHIGYVLKTIAVDGKNVHPIVYMDGEDESLREIIVIGYGSVRKKDLTGSVINLKMSDIKDLPVFSVDQALQGRIAGADIMSVTGEPGAGTSVRIRGTRSITASNEPLIVVDGVMDGVHSLADINPADIASISVLKDASSTAIYGIRGSNGVIIITTRQGESGKTRIHFKADMGGSQLPRKPDLMNASEFAQFRNDYALHSGTPYPYPNPLQWGKGTDWVDEITRPAPYQNYALSISGGQRKSGYFASFSFNDTEGIILKSGIKRYTGRLNLDYSLFP
ncbi:MAG: TonB-dependent receptor plug domain-containing protein, partial [Dysgonamonadaceae bacterium]|nr:TonB-dependent receptor plug domain-containing protein [Dysgonamonadaceae bacterium]